MINNSPLPQLQEKLKLYNTMTRTAESFQPLRPDMVGVYCCGPTVYNFQHIGNMRTYIFEDVLVRTLRVAGYKVRHVMNITDVGHLISDGDEGEDKMLVATKREGKRSSEIAKYYTEIFFADCDRLNVQRPDVVCPATEHVKQMIALIQLLEERGVAYQAGGNVYFDITKYAEYGRLSRVDLSAQMAGARISADEKKRNPLDFALWFTRSKFEGQELQWDSPWGRGYPGWHIECSAMALEYLGDSLDIHCGGTDHIGVHHTNEIAQVEGATNKPWVRTWMHGAFLVDTTGKMSKSKGKFLTLNSLDEQNIDPLAFRYLCIGTHYRKELTFGWEILRNAQTGYERLLRQIEVLATNYSIASSPSDNDAIAKYKERFTSVLADDLNGPQALAVLREMVSDSSISARARFDCASHFDQILGLNLTVARHRIVEEIPAQVSELISQRSLARQEKRWADADSIKRTILELGFDIEDGPQGTQTKRRK